MLFLTSLYYSSNLNLDLKCNEDKRYTQRYTFNIIIYICKLVGLFHLSQLQHLNINVGLYRHDGLAITNQTPRNTEKRLKKKKEICRIFKENGLSIIADAKKGVRLPRCHPKSEYRALSTIEKKNQHNQLYLP